MNIKQGLFVFTLTLISIGECFVPATIIDTLVAIVDDKTRLDFGQVSDSLSHEEILKRGLTKSVAKYLSDQKKAKYPINLVDMTRYYSDLDNLFYDYYGRKCFYLSLKLITRPVLEIFVAEVDLNPSTKDMPYAHFDAETFVQSNDRVIAMTNQVISLIKGGNNIESLKIAGQVLHTIQDFYSHSNWVEMGQSKINTNIGVANFAKLNPLVTASDTNTCLDNCELVTIKNLGPFSVLLDKLNIKLPDGNKSKYYKCPNNLNVVNKLVSGYYTDQKLDNGTSVPKFVGKMKCSHGGVLDTDSYEISAKGGINKDTGFYFLSPHANLHMSAVNLAISHTEYFFNQIRANVGNSLFDKWLQITGSNLCMPKLF